MRSHLGVVTGDAHGARYFADHHVGMVMQLLAGARLIEVNQSLKEDRALFAAPRSFRHPHYYWGGRRLRWFRHVRPGLGAWLGNCVLIARS